MKSIINSIKSSYILELIFSFLYENHKLNMTIFNKQLQKMFHIDIEDFKKTSEKYKVGEKNGKGKEYLLGTNNLIFEGEYLNEKKNGKGKEYYSDGKLLFEGEYLNGNRWNGKGYRKNGKIEFEIKDGNGKGKEYNYNGILAFEGEYLNGKKLKGKEYIFGNLKYEGTYDNGIKNGKGKEYYNNGKLSFEGQYMYGIKNGKGKEYYIDGKLLFEGEYLNGKRWNGRGYNKNGILEFEIKDGNGNGKEYNNYNGILIFEGEYWNGQWNGKVKEYDYYSGELTFEGEYLHGKRNGEGKEFNDYNEKKYLKVLISMEKEMEMEKNFIIMDNYYLKENM